MHVFYAPFYANGIDYIANITVRETSDGNKAYSKFVLEKEAPSSLAPKSPNETQLTQSGEDTITLDQLMQDVKSLQVSDPYFQEAGEGAPRGQIRFNRSRMATIELFQHADLSTVLHESGHLWLDELMQDAFTEGSSQQLRDDMDTL